MNLKNCTRCGKMFASSHISLCPDCLEADQVTFKSVRDFIKNNPRVSIDVVVEATGVAEEDVREFVRQGRIDVADLSGPVLSCKRCGKPIESGEYCVLCRQDITENLKVTAAVKEKPEQSDDEEEPGPTHFTRHYRKNKE